MKKRVISPGKVKQNSMAMRVISFVLFHGSGLNILKNFMNV